MKHSKKEMFELSKNAILENDLIFIEDIVAYLPIGKTTFYTMFTKDSDELNELKSMLSKNKIRQKVAIRKKWRNSDNPTIQLALYKLLATDEERKRLSQTFHEISGDGDNPVKVKFKFGK